MLLSQQIRWDFVDNDQLVWAREVEMEAEKPWKGYIAFIREQQGVSEYGHNYVRDEQPEYQIPIELNEAGNE